MVANDVTKEPVVQSHPSKIAYSLLFSSVVPNRRSTDWYRYAQKFCRFANHFV